MKDILVILMGVFMLSIPYFVVYLNKKSIWKTIVYGTLIWIGIAIAVPVMFLGVLYGWRCEDWLLDGTANWYQSIIGSIFLLFSLGIVLMATGLGGFISFTGPRGGEYHYSKNGNSKIYTTNS